jgi:hypothetical protein
VALALNGKGAIALSIEYGYRSRYIMYILRFNNARGMQRGFLERPVGLFGTGVASATLECNLAGESLCKERTLELNPNLDIVRLLYSGQHDLLFEDTKARLRLYEVIVTYTR